MYLYLSSFVLKGFILAERFFLRLISKHNYRHGDRYKQGDRYIQVNFAENIRQLKILGSCQVTSLYRAVIYRFDCNRLRPGEPEEDILTSRFSSNHAPVIEKCCPRVLTRLWPSVWFKNELRNSLCANANPFQKGQA